MLTPDFPQNVGYFIFKSCFLEWWKPGLVLWVSTGCESDHSQLRGSRRCTLHLSPLGQKQEWIRNRRVMKLIFIFYHRIIFYIFYKEYMLNPNSSQL